MQLEILKGEQNIKRKGKKIQPTFLSLFTVTMEKDVMENICKMIGQLSTCNNSSERNMN